MTAIAPRRPAAGFTIIELLIVTLIALIVFALGMAMISGVVRAQGQAIARVRASENARLFFQLLEKDLAASSPGPRNMVKDRQALPAYPCAAPQPDVLQEDDGGQSYDILQFYTRADTTRVTDEYVFVRYFVNRANHTLCRQVIPVASSADADAPELNNDPGLLTNDPTAAALQYALFDDVKMLLVAHRTWSETDKALLPNGIPDYQDDPGIKANSTHLRVMLVMRYTLDGGATYLERTFSKVLPAPWQSGAQ